MNWTITEAVIAPLTTALDSGLNVLVPIGISVMAVFIGITLIPKVIYRFL